MNRADFMEKLTELLADVSPAEREEAIQYYNDYFDDAGAENEQSVIASLGSPEQLARTIKTGLADGGNMGEFTEKGFSGYEPKKSDEVLDLNNPSGAGSGKDEAQGEKRGWSSSNGQAAGGWQQGTGSNGGNGWQQGRGQSGSQQYSGQAGYNEYRNSYEDNRNTSHSHDKKRMSGAMIALIVILCIFASPILLGLGGGMFGIIVGILGALFGMVVGIGAASIALLIVGVCLFVYGIVLLFSMPLGGLAMMGVGMICAALGLLFLWLTVMICGMLIPAIVRGVVKLFNNIFNRGGAAA